MAQSVCRTCDAPLVWQDTDQGRRPFNPDGSPHRDQRPSSGRPASSPARDREVRRAVAMKAAATLTAAAIQSHEEARSEMVFRLADRILEWLEKETGDA
jgi:hypothetical protein